MTMGTSGPMDFRMQTLLKVNIITSLFSLPTLQCPEVDLHASEENCVISVCFHKYHNFHHISNNVPGYVCNHGSLRERDAASENALGTLLRDHALNHCVISPTERHVVTGGRDVTARKYKSMCGRDSGSF